MKMNEEKNIDTNLRNEVEKEDVMKRLKQALKNPPPDRLAKIEYRSHALQAIGITAVCFMLFLKGFWYIIFAFVFSLGISYSQGMAAYMKYKAIKEFMPKEMPEDFIKDVSPSRKRSKIINYVFGSWVTWITSILSVVITILIIDPTLSRWQLVLLYPSSFLFLYIMIYFFPIFWIARPIYDKRMKGGKK